MTKSRIAMLGLGAMGSRMARRLLEAGFPLTVFNRSAHAADPLIAAGAQWGATPKAAVQGAAIVVSCVRDDDASREVWLDSQHGAAAALAPDALAIESSTLSPAFCRELEAALGDIAFLEAPVVGSRPQAEAGTLVHLVGGPPPSFERAAPVLAAIGQAAHHIGPVGTAAVMKLVVNGLFATQVAALGEAMGLLRKADVAAPGALAVLASLPTTSPAMVKVGAAIAAGHYAPLFPIELVAKDLDYLVGSGSRLGTTTPTWSAVAQIYAAAMDEGLGDENIHAVAKRYL